MLSVSEKRLHTLIVAHIEFLTHANTEITPQDNVIETKTIRAEKSQFNQLAAFIKPFQKIY